ncbi:MAG: hypothetical protein N3F66_14340 [Spirochaetes bacterium]|nr:hypothetical protein [Spirochaetota bacterium]
MKTKSNIQIFHFLILLTIFTITLPFITTSLFAQTTPTYTWQQISGNWSVVSDNKESYLRENRGKSFNFDYSPLINLNSLISTDEFTITQLTHTISLHAPADSITYMTFFAASDYRQFYAVQFAGNSSNIHTISIIKSDIKDTTLPKQAKGNFYITTLASREVSLEYGRTYTLTITVQGKTIAVAIDNAQVLSHTLNEEPESGKIGFASKHCIPIIDNLKVYKGKEIIFEDDFSKESIRKIVLQGRKLTPQEVEELKKKKK